MKLIKLISFVAVGVVVPCTITATNNSALAGEVHIRTPNVEAMTGSDGSVYINSKKTTVRVPSRRRYWTPWNYWSLPWQNNVSDRHTARCNQISHRSTSRVTASSSQIVQSSISHNTCK